MLDVDENEIIDIKLLPGRTAIVTGVIGEGSCFIHALLRALSPIEYMKLSEEERTQLAGEVRTIIAGNLDIDEWVKTDTASIVISDGISNVLDKLERGSTTKNKKIREAIKSNPGMKKPQNVDDIVRTLQKHIKSPSALAGELGVILENVDVATVIINEIIKHAFKKEVENLSSIEEYIGDGMIQYILESLDTLAIFINKTRGVNNGTTYNYGISRNFFEKSRRVVLIAYMHNHYENIGILVGDTVKRVFERDDPLIAPLIDEIKKRL